MAIEQDAARDGKKTIAIIGAAAVCVLGGAYLGWGYLSRSEEPESQYNLKRVASSTPVRSHSSTVSCYHRRTGWVPARQNRKATVFSRP